MAKQKIDRDAVRRQIARLRAHQDFRGTPIWRLWSAVFDICFKAGCFQSPDYSAGLHRYLDEVETKHPRDFGGRRYMLTTLSMLRNGQAWLPNPALGRLPEDPWPKGQWPMFESPPEEWNHRALLALAEVLEAEIGEWNPPVELAPWEEWLHRQALDMNRTQREIIDEFNTSKRLEFKAKQISPRTYYATLKRCEAAGKTKIPDRRKARKSPGKS